MRFRQVRDEDTAVPPGKADAQALSEVIAALEGLLESPDEDLRPLLEVVRVAFGMDYASCWAPQADGQGWRASAQAGSLGQDFADLTARYVDPGDNSEGLTSCGVALSRGEPSYADDLSALGAQPQYCERGRAAVAAGTRSTFSFPVVQGGQVSAVFDFLSRTPLPASAARQATLRALADVIALTFRLREQAQAQAGAARDRSAVTTVVSRIGACTDEESALAVALDTVREAFGWEYGSFWALDQQENVLRFAQESGSAGEDFRRVTLAASFAEGVGLSGRAWRARDLVYVPDLGQIHDCVRAPVAQKVGVKAGACFPILVEAMVVGTMDFFSTESIALSSTRAEALRNVGQLVSQRIETLRRASQDAQSAGALLQTVSRLSADADQAVQVAGEAVGRTATMAGDVQTLREASDAVGTVIAIISRIAAQTNLLALNATIEAARAGQVGRGFAVVADEVKELARETGGATEQVRQLIASIQTSTGAVGQGIADVEATIGRMDDVQTRMSSTLGEQADLAALFEAR